MSIEVTTEVIEVTVLESPFNQVEVRSPGPQGGQGPAGTIAIGTVATVDPTDPATVTNVGTASAATLNFEIPQGEKGDQGDPGEITGPGTSVTDNAIATWNGTTGTLIQESPASVSDAGVVSASGANLSGLTAETILVSDSSKNIVSSGVPASALDNLDATSSIQDQLDANATAIIDHLSDASGAHEASAITNTPLGNLAATNVQSALNELQDSIDNISVTDIPVSSLETNVGYANQALTFDSDGIPQVSKITTLQLNSGAASAGEVLMTDGLGNTNFEAVTADIIDSESALAGRVLTADGAGGASWESGGNSGGGTGISFIDWGLFEDQESVDNVVVYDDGGAYADGLGGTPSGLAVSLESTLPMRGDGSLKISRTADASGEGVTFPIPIPLGYRTGQTLSAKFQVNASANYVANDVEVKAYDSTNSQIVYLQGATKISGSGKGAVTFSLPEDVASFRLSLHCEDDNASGNWDLEIDDLQVGPDSVFPGFIGGYRGEETWADNWANTTTSVKVWRRGSRVVLEGTSTLTGTPTDTGFQVTIPAAYLPKNTTDQRKGTASLIDTGTATRPGYVGISNSTTLAVYSISDSSSPIVTYSGLSASSPHTWASTDVIKWWIDYEVDGWEEGALFSTTELMNKSTNVTATSLSTATHTDSGNWQDITFAGETKDVLGEWDGTTFTAKSAHTRVFIGRVPFSSSGTGTRALRYVASSLGTRIFSQQEGTSALDRFLPIVLKLDLSANETVKFQAFQSSGGNLNYSTASADLAIFAVFDPTSFGVYGEFKLLTATSGVKTPSATNNWLAMTGNSLTLPVGTWKLFGNSNFNNGGSSPIYTFTALGWFGANGADSGTLPAALSTLPNLTVLSGQGPLNQLSHNSSNAASHNSANVVVRVTQPTTVFLNAFVTVGTAGNARVTVYPNAEKLQ